MTERNECRSDTPCNSLLDAFEWLAAGIGVIGMFLVALAVVSSMAVFIGAILFKKIFPFLWSLI